MRSDSILVIMILKDVEINVNTLYVKKIKIYNFSHRVLLDNL